MMDSWIKYGLPPLLILGSLALPISLSAGDIKSKRERFDHRFEDSQSPTQLKRGAFSADMRQRNKDFSSLIKKKWQEFEVKAGTQNLYRHKSKPRRIKPLPRPQDPSAKKLPRPQWPQARQRRAAPTLPAFPPQRDVMILKTDLWGSAATFQVPLLLIKAMPKNDQIQEEDVRNYWNKTSEAAMTFITQARAVQRKLVLNDWGYVLLLHKTARALFPDRAAARMLWIWQMVKLSQMNARLALGKTQAVVLFASEQTIFETPRLLINRTPYYIVALRGEKTFAVGQKLKTYPEDNRQTLERPINLKMRQAPLIWQADAKKNRQLRFSFGGRAFQLDVPVNRAMLDYMAEFPLSDFSVFVDAPLSRQAAQALKAQLAPITASLAKDDPASAVNFLLRFVQTSFRYQNDVDRIGREDYFFGEETLNAPLSDCEDRVALFGWLTTNILKRKTVAVFWHGHLAAAVQLDNVRARGVQYQGRHYVYADPTFINANIGRAVPAFETKKPDRVIPIGR